MAYSPTYSQKGARRYRYYISQNLLQSRDHPNGVLGRIPAQEIEDVVRDSIGSQLTTRKKLAELLERDLNADIEVLRYISQEIRSIRALKLAALCLQKIVVRHDALCIEVSSTDLKRYIKDELAIESPKSHDKVLELTVPFSTQRVQKGAIVIAPENNNSELNLSEQELHRLVRGTAWRSELFNGGSIKAIAERENVSLSGVRKIIMGSLDIP